MKEINEKSLLSQWKNRIKEVASLSSISKAPDAISFVPSHGQQRLWFLQHLNPENPFYNHSEYYVFKGKLMPENLKEAIQLLYETHDILRSTYQLENGLLKLKIEPKAELTIQEYDLSQLSKTAAGIREIEITNNQAKLPFDLSKGPLLKVSLIKKTESEHILFLTLHHIIGDKWSLEVFNRQMAKYYSICCSNAQNEIETLPIQYQDFAYWQMKRKLDYKQLDYWSDKLTGAIANLNLPRDFSPSVKPSYKGAIISSQFETALSSEIFSLTKELKTTPYIVMLTAYIILLYRYTGQNDISIGSPISNRDQKILENLIGFFNDTVVLRTSLDPDMSFRELIGKVKETTLEAFENKDVPFEELVKILSPTRSLNNNPFFQVMFLYSNEETPLEFGSDLKVESKTFDSGTSKFDLTLFISEQDGRLTSSFEYSTDLFENSTIECLQLHLQLLLKGIVKNLDQSISKIPMLSDQEKKLFFSEKIVNDSVKEDLKKPIHRFIEAIAVENPTKTAVVFKNESISYERLNQKANSIAKHILEKTKKKNEVVGLLMNRSLEMVIGMLAILKSGCAYLPIDPDYPKKRVEFMLKDAEVNMILTKDSESVMIASNDLEILEVDKIATTQNEADFIFPDVHSNNIAYVIYTSGSTGRPKGVPITHENIVNSTLGRTEFYGYDPKSFLLLSSIAFDSSKAGLFWTLCSGGKLVISEKRMEQDIAKLSKSIRENMVSHTLMLPSLYNLILDHAKVDELQSLDTVILAGEACSSSVCEKHFQTIPEVDLYNEYGPTEATVWCVAHKIERSDLGGLIPIGKPVANASTHILNDHLIKVPYGAVGELCVSGLGLTRGYLNLTSENATRFVEVLLNPNTNKATRIYRTGDLVRYRKDGSIQFLGRKDQQVKIRGFRIEIDEIENTISTNEQVVDAIVMIEGQDQIKESVDFSNLEIDELLIEVEKKLDFKELDDLLKNLESLDKKDASL